MTSLTPARRAALQAVKDGRVTWTFADRFIGAELRPCAWAYRATLIEFAPDPTYTGENPRPVRLTPAGERALTGEEEK